MSIFSPLVAVPLTLTSVTFTVVKNFISTTPAPKKKKVKDQICLELSMINHFLIAQPARLLPLPRNLALEFWWNFY